MPHCHPFKHGFYLTGAQPAHSFAEQAVRTPARAGKAGKFPAAERAKRIKRAAGAVLCIETPPGTRYNPPFNISE
ncbi:hypothetical protein, partial [Neisseria gonorrhoeae]|uniref:hypothetical protein n=1 Tax=Neisseria gonorrhoeae TaxID=485 RepID=UPI002163BC57